MIVWLRDIRSTLVICWVARLSSFFVLTKEAKDNQLFPIKIKYVASVFKNACCRFEKCMRFKTTLLQDLIQRAITSENYTRVCLETNFRGNFGKVLISWEKQLFSDWSSLFKCSINQWYSRYPKKQILIITVPKAVAFEQALHSGKSREVTKGRSLARSEAARFARRLRKLVLMLSEALYWRI